MVSEIGSEHRKRYRKIQRALGVLFDAKGEATDPMESYFESASTPLEITSFSDNIVISAAPVPGTSNAEGRVLALAANLAISLLQEKIFCRGGVASGPTHHQDGILFGPGYMKAYELESQSANYPRIAIADSVVNELRDQFTDRNPIATLKEDFDGLWYLDMLSTICARLDSPRARIQEFQRIRNLIDSKLQETGPYKHLARWRWCAKRFNDFLRESAEESWAWSIEELRWSS